MRIKLKMKILLITDQHFGVRNDNINFLNYYERYYSEVVLPFIDKHEIDTIIDGGDTFDRRKYINYVSLDRSRRMWFDPLKERGVTVHTIIGNHDVFYKSTNSVNSPSLLLREYDNIIVYENPTDLTFGDVTFAMLPWINNENYKESMEFIKNSKATHLIGHLELAGYEMYKGSVNDHGMDYKIFDKFQEVYSGHFHHKSTRDNITYLGAPYEMTWSDYNDDRGFHIFDTETKKLTFHKNPNTMFVKFLYDDSDKDFEYYQNLNVDFLADKYVKLIIRNKTNPYWFDFLLDKIYQSGVHDLNVVEDNLHLDLEDDDDITNEAEDTITILKKYIQGSEMNTNKDKLTNLMTSLYQEALNSE